MNPLVPVAVFGTQAALMMVDELHFHRRRRLPRWERIGHPLDTATVLVCYGTALTLAPGPGALRFYLAAAIGSCLFVTKDEFVHAKLCDPAEHWLHAVLFLLHPVVLTLVALLWTEGGHGPLLAVQGMVTLAFGLYQTVYWNRPWKQPSFER